MLWILVLPFLLHLIDCSYSPFYDLISLLLVRGRLVPLLRVGYDNVWSVVLVVDLPLQSIYVVSDVPLGRGYGSPTEEAAGNSEHHGEWKDPLYPEAEGVKEVLEHLQLLIV